jgi:pyruvate dehydrogenase E2 component (dihydrolipoamide acetyltransferase)
VAEGRKETEPSAAGVRPPDSPKGETEIVELSRARQSIARRIAESRATIPHLYLSAEALIGDEVPPLEAALARAGAIALREHPDLNGSYRDGRLERYARVNVGVAVAADGVVWPTIFDADTKGRDAIGSELAELTPRAVQGVITRAELSGATFTVSALGGASTALVWPTIPPGHAAALAAGAVREARRLGLVLACDERLVDVPAAAAFLDRIVSLLEDPSAL